MAIDKMTFIDINGHADYLDEVLQRCLKCGFFQPEYAAKLREYSFGSNAMIRNPYGGLLIKVNEISSQLGIGLDLRGSEVQEVGNLQRDKLIEDSHAYLNKMRMEYPQYFEKKSKINDEIVSYSTALEMLGHIDEPEVNFDELWENKYLKIRFGRLPTPNLAKLSVYEDKPYEIYKLDSSAIYTWCFYVTAAEYQTDTDEIFYSLGFERLRIPDYVHGTTTDAKAFLREGLIKEREELKTAVSQIEGYIGKEKEAFLTLYSEIKFLYDAYDLRKYVISIKENFHLIGYVLKKNEDEFKRQFDDLAQIEIEVSPAGGDKRLSVPVQLKNNWLVKPFEMFVSMYGLPSYSDIDPSPFVAYTYSLLFGMMFGDMGHGFCVFLVGVLIWKLKKMQLGQIMSRIGIVSMVFGFLYGSVFGFEHLLDWFYVGVLGLHEKPIEVMHPDTTNKILIAAVGIGAAVILMVIIFNILIGIKKKDFDRTVLSPNGIAGLILYMAVLVALFENFTETAYLSSAQIAVLIVFPLILVFFREPITHLIEYQTKDDIIKRDKALKETTTFHEGSIDIHELFKSQFVSARFGRIPTDSYSKLSFYQNHPFMIYPVKTEHDYIWCIYTAASVDKEEIDAIFSGLYFERLYIPEDYLNTNDLAEEYIKKCVEAGGTPGDEAVSRDAKYGPVKISKSKTVMQAMFPDGVGAFFTQTFFEMFEVILSFITNTMSFLRVGGFILVHAGMMAVVFTLAEMVGGGASPIIIIVGNVFVMCLEGLIVGIQVLRLEFYEIFSRFFDAGGEPFKPVSIGWSGK